MASLFTFDPNPPRVSSPWQSVSQQESVVDETQSPVCNDSTKGFTGNVQSSSSQSVPPMTLPVMRLEAEPQEGPTEYKLHLLLRPRRSFTSMSTGRMRGSRHGGHSPRTSAKTPGDSLGASGHQQSQALPTTSRQHRLEQLTTQLLWRLQQSSPYHLSAADNLILPTLPEATMTLDAPSQPAKLLPGLEESQGALYEIGVSDDGTFVGLSKDEMDESLNNLRAMAGALGCSVEILRMVVVGDCTWYDHDAVEHSDGTSPTLHKSKLFVSEAYVRPGVASSRKETMKLPRSLENSDRLTADAAQEPTFATGGEDAQQREQLRVSLTGATTSGKSTLLGTLTTSTLDNGRGKSRLSLLKHRHEIASGMTSSLAQELIGYAPSGTEDSFGVINYATESAWTDIHTSSAPGRLAFLSDVAGHPRYARTAIRGLVACDPHWTLLCISGHERMDVQPQVNPDDGDTEPHLFPGANAHLSMVYLDLCLSLGLPLVVAITKLDATSKENLRQILSNLLSKLKNAGRRPRMLTVGSPVSVEGDLQIISPADMQEARIVANAIQGEEHKHVPIVLTSAVTGAGINKLHALLEVLPIPSRQSRGQRDDGLVIETETPSALFHVDDVFNLPVNKGFGSLDGRLGTEAQGFVVSGLLARGKVSIGHELILGPFSPNASATGYDSDARMSMPDDSFLSPRSFTDALIKATSSPKIRISSSEQEWQSVKVVSVRNLRLPVQTLHEDQAGTIGVIPLDDVLGPNAIAVRKGMVLTSHPAEGTHSFTAVFEVDHASSFIVGSPVMAYCATMRASAKIIAISLDESQPAASGSSLKGHHENEPEDPFTFQFDEESTDGQHEVMASGSIDVTFQFVTHRQWLEVGAQILVMPGGGQGLYQGVERGSRGMGGLEGFVGVVVEKYSGRRQPV